MVQGASRNTITGTALTNQDKKQEKPEAHTARKAAPSKRKPVGFYDKTNHEITSTIGRNIETVMASRLVHEGGRLTIVPMPENVDKFDTSRARISSRQMADLKKATKARMGRQQRDGTNAIVQAAKNPKKSKNNKLGPRKGYGGVDSDDEEYKKIKNADDEEIIPRDDVLTPETSDDDSPEGLERKRLSREKREARLKLLADLEAGRVKPQPAAKRRKGADGQRVREEQEGSEEEEDESEDEDAAEGEAGSGASDESDEEDDSEGEHASAPAAKKGPVKTMLGSWLDKRRQQSALGKAKAASGAATSAATAPAAKAEPAAAKPSAGATKPKAAAPAAKQAASASEPSAAASAAAAAAPAAKPAASKPKAAPAAKAASSQPTAAGAPSASKKK